MTVVIVCTVIAFCVALTLNRAVRPRLFSNDLPAIPVFVTLGPITTLAVIFFAFVLAQSTASYSRARTAVSAEANVVDNFYETAEYLRGPNKKKLHAAAVCYVRAVGSLEFPAMAKGESSTVPNNWTGSKRHGFRRTFQEIGPENNLFASLTAADQKRGDARRERLAAARPSIPPIVFAFMIAMTCLAVLALGFLSPRTNGLAYIIMLTVITCALTGAVLLIRGLDRPFSGTLAISASPMTETARQITDDFNEEYGSSSLNRLCNRRGEPRAPQS